MNIEHEPPASEPAEPETDTCCGGGEEGCCGECGDSETKQPTTKQGCGDGTEDAASGTGG